PAPSHVGPARSPAARQRSARRSLANKRSAWISGAWNLPSRRDLTALCFSVVSAGLDLQAIAAGFGDQQLWALRGRLDLLAQAIDVRLQRVGGDIGVVAPHFPQELLAPDR